MSTAVIQTTNLRKTYAEKAAVDGLELTVKEGQVFGLLGPNGAGKTTTTMMLITLLRPDSGKALVLGKDVVTEADAVRKSIGYVPQDPASDRYLTGRENLQLFASLYEVPKADQADRIRAIVDLLDLGEHLDKLVKKYSGGMRKKLDIAAGLLHEPKLIFLDEPSLGLDVSVRRAVWDHIHGLKKKGTTVFLCTNYMDEAEELCDDIAIIDRGRIVARGTPDELKSGLGGDVVCISPSSNEEKVQSQLKETLSKLDFVSGTGQDGKKILVYVDANETALPKVLDAARSASIEIGSISYTRPGLEEVFLKHTGAHFTQRNEDVSGKPKKKRR